MILKTPEEISLIRESALLVSKTLGVIAKEIIPGVSTLHLDKLAEQYIRDHNAIPGFLGLYDFPNTLCISLNEAIVHGIPNDNPIKEGDLLSVDCGVLKNGYYGDHAYTFAVGEIDNKKKQLLEVTKASLYEGIRAFKKGNRLGDIGYAIQSYTEHYGYGVVRDLVGHGIGKEMHEKPEVPNYGRRGRGKAIKEGLVLAIEPMINMGTHKVKKLDDGWTIITKDKLPSAHYEHNVAIIDGKAEILSTFHYIYKALNITQNNEESEFHNCYPLLIN